MKAKIKSKLLVAGLTNYINLFLSFRLLTSIIRFNPFTMLNSTEICIANIETPTNPATDKRNETILKPNASNVKNHTKESENIIYRATTSRKVSFFSDRISINLKMSP